MMTNNQIQYAKHLEDVRSHRTNELLGKMNYQKDLQLGLGNLEVARQNAASNARNAATNEASVGVAAQNAATNARNAEINASIAAESARHNVAVEAETRRNNDVMNDIKIVQAEEGARHNLVSEKNEVRGQNVSVTSNILGGLLNIAGKAMGIALGAK